MIEKGSQAPEFTLMNNDGSPVSLTSLQGKRVVLYFYPKDDTPGCTVEAKEFTELSEEFAKRNAVIFGVSKDSIESHCTFIEKYGLQVSLLSDPDTSTIDAYGAWQEKNNYGKKYMGIVRSTVLIDETGTILEIWSKVKAKGHAEKVLAAIDSI